MLKWMALAWGLMSGTAWASDSEGLAPDDVTAAMWQDPVAGALSAEEQKRAERLAALEASQSTKAARVVVLKWQGQDTDYTNDTLVRNVKARIARPDSKFYPEVDLYQVGRREPDKTIRATEQRATVPASAISDVMAEVEDVAPIPWNQMSESDWGLKANDLMNTADKIWFIDRPELREPLFQLYIQIGRAAENQNNPAPPFYQQVGTMTVNWYWYLAGAMAHVEPGLMAKVTDQDLYGSIDYYKQLLDSGKIAPMTIAFQEGDVWDAKAFAAEYQVFVNGLEVLIDDPDSLYKVPPGIVDVYLKRTDGHSISDRIDITKLQDKIYFVRDVARKKMGIDFIQQLFEHPNECSPELDGDIVAYLSIYAKLHKEAEIYIAVPEAGNPNRVLIWRWDRDTGTLQKVLDNTGGYPVRFALLGHTGMNFAGASVTASPPDGTFDPAAPAPPPTPTVEPKVTPNGIPFNLQLRGHYSRLLVLTGIRGMFSMGKVENADGEEIPAKWADNYRTDGNALDTGAVHEETISRTIYGGAGFVLGKEAAIGVGPRGYIQAGFTNVPIQTDLTLHGGLTTKGPIDTDGRFRTLVDLDGYVGVVMPSKHSLFHESPGTMPTFGINAGVGFTF